MLQYLDRSFLAPKIVNHYFFIALGVYLITMLNMSFRPGVAMSVVLGLVIVISLHSQMELCLTDLLVFVYIAYNLLSFFWISLPNFTFAIFLQEVITSIFPIFLYFGMAYANRDTLYFDIIISVFLCVVIGIILFVTVPEFYREYACFEGYAATTSILHVRQGLSSYIGRIPLGTYTVIAAAITLSIYSSKNSKIFIPVFLLFICASVLTAQRSSWFGSVLLLFFFFIREAKNSAVRIAFQICLMVVLTLLIYPLLGDIELLDSSQVATKSMNIFDAIAERSGQWTSTFSDTSILWGKGLGLGGHRAMGYIKVVTDGNFAKMIAEIGIIGLGLFLMITLSCVKKLYKSKDYLSLFFVFFILSQCMGSNIVALQITAPLYWMALGSFKMTPKHCVGKMQCELTKLNQEKDA